MSIVLNCFLYWICTAEFKYYLLLLLADKKRPQLSTSDLFFGLFSLSQGIGVYGTYCHSPVTIRVLYFHKGSASKPTSIIKYLVLISCILILADYVFLTKNFLSAVSIYINLKLHYFLLHIFYLLSMPI